MKTNIYSKLYELQNELGAISKDATNPFYKSKYFDINSLIGQLKPLLQKHNLVLLEGDSIVIPKMLDVVQITGDLQNINGASISSPFFGKRANYYVRNFAGGFSENNKKSKTIVVHANGVTKKSLNLGFFSISPKVKPGSTIRVISEKNIIKTQKDAIDYNRHIESVIVKITAVMSLYLLIERVNGSF